MNLQLKKLLNQITPFVILGICIFLFFGLFVMLFYVLLWGILIGIVLWIAAWIKSYFFKSRSSNITNHHDHKPVGRTIEHDEE